MSTATNEARRPSLGGVIARCCSEEFIKDDMQSESHSEQSLRPIVRRLAGAGVELCGLVPGEPIPALERDILRRSFIDGGILALRRLGDSAASWIDLSRVFGECVPHRI